MFWLFSLLQLALPPAAWYAARRIYRHYEAGEKVHPSILRRHFVSYQAGACTLAVALWFVLVAIAAAISGSSDTYLWLIFFPLALALGLAGGAYAWSVEIQSYLAGRPSAKW